jgi:hypothetical protein
VSAIRPKAPMPENIQRQVDHLGLTLVRRWWGVNYIVLAAFAVLWNGFMAVWFTIAVTEMEWIMIVGGSIHLAVGLGLIYAAIAGFFNKTYINVNRQHLTIGHAPIPWTGNKMIESGRIRQLYCVEKQHRRRNGDRWYSYDLRAVMDDGVYTTVLKGMQGLETARYLEQEIESHLGLKHIDVEGEFKRV